MVTSQKSVTVGIGGDMSRDYIFRGFHPDENGSKTITLNGKKIKGEWVEGSLLSQSNKKSQTYIVTHDDLFIAMTGCAECDVAYFPRYQIEVIPETVGQYTGQTDVGKDKIFDGDRVILNEDFDEVFTIEWDEDTARFVIEGNGVCYDFDNVMDYQIQVVGNKWQEVEE